MNYNRVIFKIVFLIQLLMMVASCSSENSDSKTTINELIDEWHIAASNAEYDLFFNKMHVDAIYLGTQADERWSKNEFSEFAKPYFDRGKAWSFKPFNRQLYLSGDDDIVWFEESLLTWMGVCRGSGVVIKDGDEWKIIHYNLSVTISNSLVGEFIELIKKDSINDFLLEK